MGISLKTSRFGTIEVAEDSILEFRSGIPGFPAMTRYTLVSHSDSTNFVWLQSIEDADLAFLLVDPIAYEPSYDPQLPDDWNKDLEVSEKDEVVLMCVSRIPPGKPLEATVNLAAPIVVNVSKRIAAQVILETDDFPVRHPLFGKEARAA